MGNTQFPEVQIENGQDHPHIHGEYQVPITTATGQTGSPPHTWGIQSIGSLITMLTRITPTYTGNTNVKELQKQIL